MMARYFALMPEGYFEFIGKFDDETLDCFESEKGQEAIWVFDEDTAHNWRDQLETLLYAEEEEG